MSGSNTIAIIAVIAALVSAFFAGISWWYNKERIKSAVALEEVKVEHKRVDSDKIDVKFLFIFKNVGEEPLKITGLSWGYFDFKKKIFGKPFKERALVNAIHSEGIFNHPAIFTISGIDPQITDKFIGEYFQAKFEEIWGKFAIVFKLKYKGVWFFSKEKTIKYFIGYKGRGSIYHIREDEYKEMESKLPEEFKF